MKFIKHRVNASRDLKDLNPQWGVEIDLRANPGTPKSLYLNHDPWKAGEDFGEWLKAYNKAGIQGTLILNTKEDGLEEVILEYLEEYKISNFFFLDTQIPTLINWVEKRGQSHFALRYSEYEDDFLLERFRGRLDWIWVDCFGARPVDTENLLKYKNDYRICLVSPEMQKGSLEDISQFEGLYQIADSICTKSPPSWDVHR